jgi:hypothetical protein
MTESMTRLPEFLPRGCDKRDECKQDSTQKTQRAANNADDAGTSRQTLFNVRPDEQGAGLAGDRQHPAGDLVEQHGTPAAGGVDDLGCRDLLD